MAVLCGGNGESHANRYKRYIVPVLSVQMDFVRVYTSASAMKNTPLKLSFVEMLLCYCVWSICQVEVLWSTFCCVWIVKRFCQGEYLWSYYDFCKEKFQTCSLPFGMEVLAATGSSFDSLSTEAVSSLEGRNYSCSCGSQLSCCVWSISQTKLLWTFFAVLGLSKAPVKLSCSGVILCFARRSSSCTACLLTSNL